MVTLTRLQSIAVALQVIVFFSTHLDASTDLWEVHLGIVKSAITLNQTEEKGGAGCFINVSIKNISTSVQALEVTPGNERGFKFFTIDSDNIKHRLHDRAPAAAKGTTAQDLAEHVLQETEAYSGSAHLEQIAPNETISRSVSISPAELALVKNCRFQCSFTLIDPKTSQAYHFQSSPRILTKTTLPPLNK